MLCKCYWIVLYIVHVTVFCLGGRFFPDTVYIKLLKAAISTAILTYHNGHLNTVHTHMHTAAHIMCEITKHLNILFR